MEFDLWRDYLQLALVVQEIAKEGSMNHSKVASSRNPPIPMAASKTPTHDASNGHATGADVQPNAELGFAKVKASDGMCNFCKHNGESRFVYTSHTLKSPDGVVTCPILRKYVCPLCGATGDFSHTLKYCPLNQEKECLYRKSGRNSAGRKVKR
ncbi:nanos homolog 2 [Spea bombifrons]|uniref:nanos homolog 2 n=1 Tax=Spea bombifrons TaxID=233779 RepID=UPI0023495AA1|nr:nanos homolog 2 [Spea bombifrons]